MKKYIAAAAALVVALVAGFGVKQATNDATCVKPRTILGSEQAESIKALEAYISENVAPKYKHPQYLAWESDDFSPIILPNEIAAHIVVYEGYGVNAKHFHIRITRDCQGGEWKVVEFKPEKGAR